MGTLNSRRGLLNNWKSVGRIGARNAGYMPVGAPSPEPPPAPPAPAAGVQTEAATSVTTEGSSDINTEA